MSADSLEQSTDKRRLGIVAVILKRPDKVFNDFNALLHQYSAIIVGRMGLPYKERGISVVSLIVDGTNEEIGALTGKIGQLPDVNVKAVLTHS
ncbi:MAG: iron-only hydrogenase system regulator [Candidatus Riflebacteria bacterium]|nr:iron-only hydrogenase system regulator [Candidatus Riflebacteria bacterium]